MRSKFLMSWVELLPGLSSSLLGMATVMTIFSWHFFFYIKVTWHSWPCLGSELSYDDLNLPLWVTTVKTVIMAPRVLVHKPTHVYSKASPMKFCTNFLAWKTFLWWYALLWVPAPFFHRIVQGRSVLFPTRYEYCNLFFMQKSTACMKISAFRIAT